MKLGKRHVRRGHLAKVREAKHPVVARMLAAPPARPRWKPAVRVLHPAPATAVLADVTRATPWAPETPRPLDLQRMRGDAVLVASDRFAFGGSFEDLNEAREHVSSTQDEHRPLVVALDYFVHTIQVERAAENGADAVLLIARLVDDSALSELVRVARARALEPIVECATTDEAAHAEALEVRIVAVSARDRDSLRASEIAPELLAAIERFEVRLAFSVDEGAPFDAAPFDAVFVRPSC
jgi:indole-3-glycerol phosphate synthase